MARDPLPHPRRPDPRVDYPEYRRPGSRPGSRASEDGSSQLAVDRLQPVGLDTPSFMALPPVEAPSGLVP
jgi:hypothetical protein